MAKPGLKLKGKAVTIPPLTVTLDSKKAIQYFTNGISAFELNFGRGFYVEVILDGNKYGVIRGPLTDKFIYERRLGDYGISKNKFYELAGDMIFDKIEILKSEAGDDAGLIGAAALLLE